MKNLIAVMAFVLVSQAHAQNGQGNLQGEGAVLVPVESVSAAQANPQSASGNQIYILNSQRGSQSVQAQARQGQVQEQPVTVIQEAPLRNSQAEAFRNKRKGEEASTEDGIVQALEKARMDDEVRRRDKFNNAIGASQTNGSTIVGDNNQVSQTQVISQPAVQQNAPVVATPVEVVPVVVAKPKQKIHVVNEAPTDDGPDIVEVDDRHDRVTIRNEIRASFDDRRRHDDHQSYYVGALAAFGNYDNVINVDRSMGWGIVIGTQTAERWVAEGAFTYGNYKLEDVYNGCQGGYGGCGYGGIYNPILVDMKQMNFQVAGKYVILPGRFKPTAGAALSYTRRTYSSYDVDFRSSDALDVGGLLGADLQVSDSFSIGVDFRYFTNLGYRQNTDRNQSFVHAQQRNDPESLDYYMINLIGKFTF